ncbi:MAG TPA: hypothetical protein VK629_06290 [Steroidobacteraceae bacterium]|nr:hypothetical protein [Steroidobacteraceae bacterium]
MNIHPMKLLVVLLVAFNFLAAAFAGAAARGELEKLPNKYAYSGPKIESIALCIRGPANWLERFPKQLASDLKARGLRVVDATDLSKTAESDDETLRRINEAGVDTVMFVSIRAASNPFTANAALSVHVRDSSGALSWQTDYANHSGALGKGGRLIRASSKHIVDALTSDGLISK